MSPEGSVVLTADMEVYQRGDRAVLTCAHLGGPGNVIRWLRNDSLLAQETENELMIGDLIIGEVLTCTVSNAAGEESASIVLNIAPVITSHPSDVLPIVSQAIEFCCEVSSHTLPEYEWFKVNGSLPASVEESNTACLTVSRVRFGDEGEYYCTGTSNGISVTSDTALLTCKSADIPLCRLF